MPAQISGIVTTADGTPAAGATVALGGASPRHPDIGLITDEEGRYRFTGLAPGVYTVIANASGHAQGSAEVEAVPGETATLDVRLGPG